MTSWKAVCPVAKIAEGEPVGVSCGSRQIALYMINGEIYATDNICSHAYGLLSTGFIDEYAIECPLHGAVFDVRSGKCQDGLYEDIQAFPVEVRDGEVFICLEDQQLTT
jgi:NAD(P)H-dependent nitrite reductase small subunit